MGPSPSPPSFSTAEGGGGRVRRVTGAAPSAVCIGGLRPFDGDAGGGGGDEAEIRRLVLQCFGEA